MIIKELNAKDLEAFVNDKAFEQLLFIPISRHRAISQIHNPRAEPDDVLLFLAYEGDDMIGYLGVLPDYYFNEQAQFKVGWLSCFWVDPAQRGKGISNALGYQAVEKWKGRLVATEFTPPSKKLWLKINALDVFTTLEGIRGFLQFDLHELLPRKRPSLKKIKPLLQLADWGLNMINSIRLNNKIKSAQSVLTIERVTSFDAEMEHFIHPFQQTSLFRRSTEDFNWILSYPWILPLDKNDGLRDKYYFTANENRFDFQLLKIRNAQNKLLAVLLISIRNRHLKTQYAFFSETQTHIVMKTLYGLMVTEGIATFTTFNPYLTAYIKNNKTPFIYKKSLYREYLASDKVTVNLPDSHKYTIYDGDGDCVFT